MVLIVGAGNVPLGSDNATLGADRGVCLDNAFPGSYLRPVGAVYAIIVDAPGTISLQGNTVIGAGPSCDCIVGSLQLRTPVGIAQAITTLYVPTSMRRRTTIENGVVDLNSPPMGLGAGQSATLCVVNTGDRPVPVRLDLQAVGGISLTGGVYVGVADPGIPVCLTHTPQPGDLEHSGGPTFTGGVFLGNVSLGGPSSGVPVCPDGDCVPPVILGSLQIRNSQFNNTFGPTVLYAPLVETNRRRRGKDPDEP